MKINPFYAIIVAAVIFFGGMVFVFNPSSTDTSGAVSTTIEDNANSSENLILGNQTGNLAPDFTFKTIEGQSVKLSDFKGKYVLFASMATWCTPCQREAGNVRNFQNKHPELDLVVIQVDVDPNETNQDLINFKNSLGNSDWLMGFDDGTITQSYNFRTFDATIIVDPDGKIIYRDDGWPVDGQTLESLLV